MSSETGSMIQGAIRFAIVSVAAYGIWAFGGRMSTTVLYSSITAAYLGLSGLLLHPLLGSEPKQIGKFYAVFVPAFLAYAVLWCLGWFGVKGHEGEILGSAAGLAVFVAIFGKVFQAKGVFLKTWAVLFLCHTVGYTLGGMLYELLGKQELPAAVARLSWGLGHGLGFGAGLGYLLWHCQPRVEA